ncbi:hypothetical protein S40285_07873 [Stachybotrys chlorohalonatus IBT 40285]|uniref:Phosphoglycerate mutase n=1 Tax=Stachybotrys chlorohalonatus (strain IBT 40285) TaxID=1283841 RepID=A0A084Q974_STAC4|nr:hypothetical protein S40285_07873 [Stachybotrys chlorohalonata IBT 40285]
MSAPPSHIFVVRHGNRLDAADKKWHLSSPTPYDPPLTYGGFLQARQVGNQIWSILEQAKLDYEVSRHGHGPSLKRKRFKIVIHSSPFLRCVQTSVGISSGLAQSAPDSIYSPADVVAPAVRRSAGDKPEYNPSTILRLDSFLGEWLAPEYFEMITPPPISCLMLGGAKAELLRRVDYTKYATQAPISHTGALWGAAASSEIVDTSPPRSPGLEDVPSGRTSAETLFFQNRERKGYKPPKPNYAVSSAGKIPDGIVEHARDSCTAIDYQWDSTRPPLDFGDGGKFGEEWVEMHRRFRKGLKHLVNWYCTDSAPAEMVTTPVSPPTTRDDVDDADDMDDVDFEQEQVETVVILVSHGAGCNALIGAITHQPVLMDVGIASITMASLKPGVEYSELHALQQHDATGKASVPVDQMYDIRISASTEHLHSNASTPVSARSSSVSVSNGWNGGSRGRTSTLGSMATPVMNSFAYTDSFSIPGSRSTSASATVASVRRRESGARRPVRGNNASGVGNGAGSAHGSTQGAAPSPGLWTPVPSSLRLMDDGEDSQSEDLESVLPRFDQSHFKVAMDHRSMLATPPHTASSSGVTTPTFEKEQLGPRLAAPIKLRTNLGPEIAVEEASVTELGDSLGGLWSLPRPPDDAERFRDLSQTKRRWTVNERG